MKRLLLPLTLLALACAGTAFSSAAFTGRGDTGSSTFSSGRLAITSDRDGQAVLDAAGMRPGQMREGTVIITNTGDVDARFTLVADALGDDTLAHTVALAIDDCTHGCGGDRPFAGKLAELATPADLGVLNPGEKRVYRVRLRWPSNADDPALQGAATSFHLIWKASA
jgi:hypothetical protein